MSILQTASCDFLYEIFNFIDNKDKNALIRELTTFSNDLFAYLANQEPSESYENELHLQRDSLINIYEDRVIEQNHIKNISRIEANKNNNESNSFNEDNEEDEETISRLREHNTHHDLKLDFNLDEINVEFKFSIILFVQKYAKNINLDAIFEKGEEMQFIKLLIPLCVIKYCVGTVLSLLEMILERIEFSPIFSQISIGLLHASIYKYKHVKKLFRKFFFNSKIYQTPENQKIAREKIFNQFFHCATDFHLPIRHLSIEGIQFYQQYLNIQIFSESNFQTVLQNLSDPDPKKVSQNLSKYSYYEYIFVLNLEDYDLKGTTIISKFLDLIPRLPIEKPSNIIQHLFKNVMQSERITLMCATVKFILKIIAKLLPAIPDANCELLYHQIFSTLRNEKLKGYIDYFLKYAKRNKKPIKFSPEFQKNFIVSKDPKIYFGFQRADEIKLIQFWVSVVYKNGLFKDDDVVALVGQSLNFMKEKWKISSDITIENVYHVIQLFSLAAQILSYKPIDNFKINSPLIDNLIKVYLILAPKVSISLMGAMKEVAEAAPLTLFRVFQQNFFNSPFNSDEIFLSLKLFTKVPKYRTVFLKSIFNTNVASNSSANLSTGQGTKLTNPNSIGANANNPDGNVNVNNNNGNNNSNSNSNNNKDNLMVSFVQRLHFNQINLIFTLLFHAFAHVLNNKNDEKRTKYYGLRMKLEMKHSGTNTKERSHPNIPCCSIARVMNV